MQAKRQDGAQSPASVVVLLGVPYTLHDTNGTVTRRGPQPDHKGVCSRALMSWTLPTPLLLFAGIVALWPLTTIVVHRPTSSPRLLVEAFAVTLAVIGAFWVAWVAYWLIEQRW